MNHLHRAWKDEAAVRLAAADRVSDGVDIDAVHRRTGSRDWLDTQPQPAEASTEVGSDDLDAARGIVFAIPAALLAWAVIAAGAVAFKYWPQIAALFGP